MVKTVLWIQHHQLAIIPSSLDSYGKPVKIWMLSKFCIISVFITNCDKKTSRALFGAFWKEKKKLQSVTRRESFTNFKIIIRKRVRFYKMRQYLLQSILSVIKCDQSLLQSTASSLWDWNTGLVSSGVSLTLWGEGASLALIGYPFSDGITIKNSYRVEFLWHQSA